MRSVARATPSVARRPRARAAALERITELEPRIGELGTEELDELEQLAVEAHGEYTAAAFALRGQVRTRRQALTDAAATTADPGAAVDDSAADEAAVRADAKPAAEDLGDAVEVDEAAAVADDGNGERQDA